MVKNKVSMQSALKKMYLEGYQKGLNKANDIAQDASITAYKQCQSDDTAWLEKVLDSTKGVGELLKERILKEFDKNVEG